MHRVPVRTRPARSAPGQRPAVLRDGALGSRVARRGPARPFPRRAPRRRQPLGGPPASSLGLGPTGAEGFPGRQWNAQLRRVHSGHLNTPRLTTLRGPRGRRIRAKRVLYTSSSGFAGMQPKTRGWRGVERVRRPVLPPVQDAGSRLRVRAAPKRKTGLLRLYIERKMTA